MAGLRLQFKIVIAISICTGITNAFYKYKSSYAFLNIRSDEEIAANTNKADVQFCMNFQEWRERDLPASLYEAPIFRFHWWNSTENDLDVCKERDKEDFLSDAIIPVEYETNMTKLIKKCPTFEQDQKGFLVRMIETKTPMSIGFLVELMKKKGHVKNILFVMEKGAKNAYGKRNYLFTNFHNSDINDSDTTINVFYVYKHVFRGKILPILEEKKHSELRIFQPQSQWPMDPAVIVLWFIAFICILIGSLWSAADTKSKLESEKRINGDESRTELTIEDGEQRCVNREPGNNQFTAQNQLKRSDSAEIARMTPFQHCCYVSVGVFFIVFILMFAFFFRTVAVLFFNLFVLLFGTLSVHSCSYAFLQWTVGGWDILLGTMRQLCCCFRSSEKRGAVASSASLNGGHQDVSTDRNQVDVVTVPPTIASESTNHDTEQAHSTTTTTINAFLNCRIYLFSTVMFILALGFCLLWFIVREEYYAFLLLDPINVCLCVYIIRASKIHTLRLITFLLSALFVYDLFMVFGTRLITSDGCSVMMQVVTGADCGGNGGNDTRQFQPVAPIDVVNVPERLPLVFTFPMLADPMQECYDIDVEREYKRVLLGLGDVIVPGYLITYCFYVDVMKGNKFHTYGIIGLIGYSLGMFCTFVAMLFMETGQPALIYLVPCTLIPICAWALFGDTSGTLKNMWQGKI